jgi:hypothetical protein
MSLIKFGDLINEKYDQNHLSYLNVNFKKASH